MTRNSNALMRDGSVMAHSDLVDFLSGSTDSAINFSGSADLHIPIHPPPYCKSSDDRTSGYPHNLFNLYFLLFPWLKNYSSYRPDLYFRPAV